MAVVHKINKTRKTKIILEKLRLENGKTKDDDFQECPKKHLHPKYISPANIEINTRLNQDPELLEMIDVRCKLTGLVKIESDFSQYGTGFVQRVILQEGKKCPCLLCETGKTSANSYGRVAISTAQHVLFDDEENRYLEKISQVILNYDKDGEEPNNEEAILYGNTMHSIDEDGDWCVLECVSHNMELLETLKTLIEKHYILGDKLRETYGQKVMIKVPVIVISHPHGCAKQISIGELQEIEIDKEVRDDQFTCTYSYDTTTCCGSSGGSVYILGKWLDGFGYWFGRPPSHMGSEDVEKTSTDKNEKNRGKSSLGVESRVN